MKLNTSKLAGLILGACLIAGALWAVKMPSQGTVNCSDLNVRTGPGTNYSVVGLIHSGDSVQIIDVSGKWFKVNTGSHQGRYVYAGYIDVTDYAEINDDDASKKPYATLHGNDPKRPEATDIDPNQSKF